MILHVDKLNVFLGESHILHDVSFEVPQGGVTALLGRNGAGKTTTLRALMALAPATGQIRLAGQEISHAPPENREVFAGLTVQENLRLAERPGGPHHYDRVFSLFPRLKERLRQRAGTMSGGEQQMLALARALLNDNQLLLIDEPSQGLAPHLVTELTEVLAQVADLVTVLLVEQNLAMVRRLARHAIVLDQGRVVWTGSAEELLSDQDTTRQLLGVGVAGRSGGGV